MSTSHQRPAFACKAVVQNDFEFIKLTARQRTCALHLLQGMKYKEIAEELQLSSRTIECYVNQLKQKLKCRSKVELVIKLMRIGERV
jgi:DNA-binding NarL/FixJ family response regulator